MADTTHAFVPSTLGRSTVSTDRLYQGGPREITGLGLKNSKDLVEAWMANHPGTCQDSPKMRGQTG